jgi:hypothetical protein
LLPLFYVTFKYSFCREGDGHVLVYILFLLIAFVFLILTVGGNNCKRSFMLVFLGMMAILCLSASIAITAISCINTSQQFKQAIMQELTVVPKNKIAWLFGSLHNKKVMKDMSILQPNFSGFNNIKHLVFYRDYKNSLLEKSDFTMCILPQKVLAIIGKSSVDIYPVLLSSIIANNLNWNARPVMQSYVSYTPYLDNLNAVHFSSSDKSPQYIIWSNEKPERLWVSDLDECDNKYILNGEPNTIYQLFKWYKIIWHNDKYTVFARQKNAQLAPPTNLQKLEAQWDTWIIVPKKKQKAFLRAQIITQKTLLGKVKNFLYKLGDVMLDYKLSDGTIVSKRIVLATAINGLWISPYRQALSSTPQKVTAIRLRHDKDDFFWPTIKIQWQEIMAVP